MKIISWALVFLKLYEHGPVPQPAQLYPTQLLISSPPSNLVVRDGQLARGPAPEVILLDDIHRNDVLRCLVLPLEPLPGVPELPLRRRCNHKPRLVPPAVNWRSINIKQTPTRKLPVWSFTDSVLPSLRHASIGRVKLSIARQLCTD